MKYFLSFIFIVCITISFPQTKVTGHVFAEVVEPPKEVQFNEIIVIQPDKTLLVDTVYNTKIYE